MDTAIQLITGPGGALIFALSVLWAGWKRYWVFGWQYKDIAAEKEEWKEAALHGTRVAARAADLALTIHAKEGQSAP